MCVHVCVERERERKRERDEGIRMNERMEEKH